MIEPYLVRAGLYTVPDPSTSRSIVFISLDLTLVAYGRWNLPNHPPHSELLNDPSITKRYRRVYLRPATDFKSTQEYYDSTEIIDAEDVLMRPEELEAGVRKGGRWVFYIVFEMPEAPEKGWAEDGRGRGRDLMLVHGKSAPIIHHLFLPDVYLKEYRGDQFFIDPTIHSLVAHAL